MFIVAPLILEVLGEMFVSLREAAIPPAFENLPRIQAELQLARQQDADAARPD